MKIKQRKDKIFLFTMVIIVGNLVYSLMSILPYIATTDRGNLQAWMMAFADIMGIAGILWLVREERRRRKDAKTQETQEQK